MKVLIVSFYYAPELGAAPSRITNMAEGLLKQGAEVEVLTCLPNYPKGRIFEGYRGCFSKKETLNGVNVYRYWTYATVSKNPIARVLSMCSFGLTMWRFAFKRNTIRSYDRVIIQSPPIMVAFSAVTLFSCLYGKKTILNISDLWPLSAVELGAVKEGSFMHKFMCWMEKFNYKHSTAFQGQSNEIVQHVHFFESLKPGFLYRNLQHDINLNINRSERKPLRIVYAGLLGVAQDILGIVSHIDFKKMGAELHIYGGGNQTIQIEDYIKNHDTGVFYHGYLDKKQMVKVLAEYHASVVPLAVRIKGAVPSKIFDLLPVGVPILFCGGGEGAEIIQQYKIGLVSEPGNYTTLENNIAQILKLSDSEYDELKQNCLKASQTDFSFNKQIEKYYNFLVSLDK